MAQFLHPEGRAWLLDHLLLIHPDQVIPRGTDDAGLVISHEIAHGNRRWKYAVTNEVRYYGVTDDPHDAARILMVRQGGEELRRLWPAT